MLRRNRGAVTDLALYDLTGESVDWGAPGEARHAWKGMFFTT